VADYQVIDRSMLVKDVPEDKWYDYDYLISLLNWEANVDPEFKNHYFTEPIPAHPVAEMTDTGYHENWITYGSNDFSAKELTIHPGRTVTIKDAAAYGLICIQGYGSFGNYQISSPSMLLFNEMSEDEFFVTMDAATRGVKITNKSTCEPLVILKHFNPGNPEKPSYQQPVYARQESR
jgi:hypothetical protein